VSFNELIEIFIEEVPFNYEHRTTLIQALNEKQKLDESASEFILRQLARVQEADGFISENILIDAFCSNIATHVSDYINNFEIPTDIASLQNRVREFEKRRDSRPKYEQNHIPAEGTVKNVFPENSRNI